MGYRRASCISFVLSIIFLCLGDGLNSKAFAESGKLVYVTDGLDLPFWRYVAVGVSDVAKTSGFGYAALDSHHDAQTQMQNTQDALAKDTAGIVLSPRRWRRIGEIPSRSQLAWRGGRHRSDFPGPGEWQKADRWL
jgi:ribose transport system substrate-binding protein